uniref:Uncharacterized protein n=1 Tax=Plectus sambesii TaxID=2011161 RepID=A0A914X8B2_9BILA
TTTDQLKKTHEKELMGAKSACELALRSSAAQTDMLRRERDHLAAKLDQLERDLDLTHQQMASELQAKLAAKYHELLAEFGYHHAGLYAGGVSNQGGAAGASAWSQHDNYGTSTFTGNLAQEFLSDLGHTFPIVTPRSTDEHGAGYGSNLDQASGRRSHLQGVLKQVLPPRDQRRQGHSSNQGHPTDPDK